MGYGWTFKDGDWAHLRQIIQKISRNYLGPESSPTFGDATVTNDLTVGGDLDITGDVEITGNLTITGSTSGIVHSDLTTASLLWSAAGHVIDASIVPGAGEGNAHDIGSSGLKFQNGWFNNRLVINDTAIEGGLGIISNPVTLSLTTDVLGLTGESFINLTTLSSGLITINSLGVDANTVIKGLADDDLIFVDAGLDTVGIGTNTPGYKFDVNGTLGVTGLSTLTGGAIIPVDDVAFTFGDGVVGSGTAGSIAWDSSGNFLDIQSADTRFNGNVTVGSTALDVDSTNKTIGVGKSAIATSDIAGGQTLTLTNDRSLMNLTPIYTLGADISNVKSLTFNLNVTNLAGYDITNYGGVTTGLTLVAAVGPSVITNAYGYKATYSQNGSGRSTSLTVANADMLWIAAPAINYGTVAQLTGIRIEDIAGGTANYAILTGAGPVSFGDTLGVSGVTTLETYMYIKESSAPANKTDYGALYTNTLNELRFKDGADGDHLIHADSFSSIWFHGTTPLDTVISNADELTKTTAFANVGQEDDLLNSVGSTANNEITVGSNGAGRYRVSYSNSIKNAGAASKEFLIVPGIELASAKAITGTTLATPIVVTSTAHGLKNGDMVTISGCTGNTAANGDWVVTNKADNTFELYDLSGTAAIGAGTDDNYGTIDVVYPGSLTTHREISNLDIGVGASSGIVTLSASDKVSLYCANLDDANNLSFYAVVIAIERIGD
jgi:hypothetical protein